MYKGKFKLKLSIVNWENEKIIHKSTDSKEVIRKMIAAMEEEAVGASKWLMDNLNGFSKDIKITSCVLCGKVSRYVHGDDVCVIEIPEQRGTQEWEETVCKYINSYKVAVFTFEYESNQYLRTAAELVYCLKPFIANGNPPVIGTETNTDYNQTYDIVMVNDCVMDRIMEIPAPNISHKNAVLEGLENMRRYDGRGDGIQYQSDGKAYTVDEMIQEIKNDSEVGKKFSNEVYTTILSYMAKFSQDAD